MKRLLEYGLDPAFTAQLNALGRRGEAAFFLVDFEQRKPLVWSGTEMKRGGGARVEMVFPGARLGGPLQPPTDTPTLHPDYLPFSTYQRGFEIVQEGLQRGDSFLCNLTYPTPLQRPVDLAAVYAATEAKYRIHLPGQFVCFSPETFITISATGYLETRPMKGTAEDTPAGRAALLVDRKEIAEHATVVDLLRNDLSRVARGVRVTDYRYLHRIANGARALVQTSTKIGGQLPPNWRAELGDLLARLLPAGSVSGAPKPATLELIRRAEVGPRGYYCGVAGYFDGRTLDSCVLIRLIEQAPDGRQWFHSGGGITALSEVGAEYGELGAKVRLPLVPKLASAGGWG